MGADVGRGVVDKRGELHRGIRERLALQGGVEDIAQAQRLLRVDDVRQLHIALIDAPIIRNQHQQQAYRGQRHDLAVLDARDLEVRHLHNRGLLGHLGQQLHGAPQHVFEVHPAFEEGEHGAALCGRERLDVMQRVDELAVTLLGGHPPGARVFLGNEALGLEHGHVVADRRRGHAQLVALQQGLRADGRLGGDVVRDDGAQDLLAASIGRAGHVSKAIRSGGR